MHIHVHVYVHTVYHDLYDCAEREREREGGRDREYIMYKAFLFELYYTHLSLLFFLHSFLIIIAWTLFPS